MLLKFICGNLSYNLPLCVYKAILRLAKFVLAKPTKIQPLSLFAEPITLFINIQLYILENLVAKPRF